jgi:acyl carrier protein
MIDTTLSTGVGAQVRDILAEFFAVSPETVTADTIAEEVPGWDSTTHVGLILALEDALNVEFSVDQVVDFENVGQLAEACERLVAEKA